MTEGISNPEFYKWRTLVAMAHADGVVTPEEREMLQGRFEKIGFSKAQRDVLEEDIQNPGDPSLMMSKIEDESQRADLMHLAHLLFWSDGEFHEAERKMFELIKSRAKERRDGGDSASKAPFAAERGKKKTGFMALLKGVWTKILGQKAK
jgi:tellurite resistance protein